MREVLQTLHNHRILSREEAKNILTQISKGDLNNSQIASFLTIFLMRKITIEELAGFRDALLELCIPVDLTEYNPIDLCGTGGDGKNTFNISTLASFVVAGSGVKVAKHGNYGVSSTSGSSNVIEKLGFSFTNDIYKIKSQIETANICFLHAPLFHPAMKLVAPIRKELGVKTFFNTLGPMVNPSKPKKQIVGVYSLELLRLYKYLYQQTDKDYSIIYSLDGYDEISLTSDFRIVSNNEDRLMTPEEYDFQKLKQEQLFGGNTVEESAKIFLKIISGDGSKAQNNVVIVNAATAIKVATGNSLEDSIFLASESLKSGKAYESLKQLLTI
jgi:anthranilate phosphoribosyltransferase